MASFVRVSHRIILKITLDNQPSLNIISIYAPQSGSEEFNKDIFWDVLYKLLLEIPTEEMVHLAGDLTGHVGDYGGCQGSFSYGTRNPDENRILQFASTLGLAIINTYYKKNNNHLVTYSSGESSTQIDSILARKNHLGR